MARNRIAQAIDTVDESYQINLAFQNEWNQIFDLDFRAELHLRLGEEKEAIECWERAREMCIQFNHHPLKDKLVKL